MSKCIKCGRSDLEWVKVPAPEGTKWRLYQPDGKYHDETCKLTPEELEEYERRKQYKKENHRQVKRSIQESTEEDLGVF